MRFFAYHGLLEQERNEGSDFEVDCEYETGKPVRTDNETAETTIDYSLIYEDISLIVIQKRFNLLEALAEKLADLLYNKYSLERVKIRVRKLNPPLPGSVDSFEVVAERIR